MEYLFENHRPDFKTCPHCDHVMSSEKWDDAAFTMTTRIIQGKHGSAAIFSECPDCGGNSWVHHPLNSFYPEFFPKQWVDRAKRTLKARTEKAKLDWSKGLCRNCKHLTAPHVSTHAWRSCFIGIGPTMNECEEFEIKK